MATAIRMPDIGTTVEHVKLVRWLKQVGEPVKRGEMLCEVETDKATSEMECIAEGVLLQHAVTEGSDVEQGSIIAYVGAAGEKPPSTAAPSVAIGAASAATATPATSLAKIPVSPLVRNIAKRAGIDLSRVTGTGPGGRILREDVLKAAVTGKRRPSPSAIPISSKVESATALSTALSTHQSVIARRVVQSHREIPPINLTARIDLSAVKEYRRRMEEENLREVSYDAFFVFAVARALKEFPHFRSHLEGEKVVTADAIHVGVAISAGEELFTPVIRQADAKSILEIHTEIRALAKRIVQRSISAADMAGAALTISNLGMYPVHSFEAVIPPDQSAALAIGCAEETPVARNGSVRIVPVAVITLSVDHRLINGREAGRFLAQLKQVLEHL